MTDKRLVVWQLSDGKRGHERQCEGLITALDELVALECHRIRVTTTRMRAAIDAARSVFPDGAALPAPALIVAAGSACQWPLLAARRAYGGRSIYLMRPLLPRAWFDVCVIPAHDQPAPHRHVIVSAGPLNPMRSSEPKNATLGMILVGGPSAHYGWDTAAVVSQIERIIGEDRSIRWQVTDSRRTPAAFAAAARASPVIQTCFKPVNECEPEWLQVTLARASQAWVSADSIAMIFEALSAGARVGLIEVPVQRDDRISRVASDLVARGWVGRLGAPAASAPELKEAQRCAQLLVARWPDLDRVGNTR